MPAPILLITKAIVAAKLQTSIGYEEAAFNAFIEQAQEFDFKPLVRKEFYFELIQKRADADWKKLIDGGSYDHDGITYQFKGIADVLAYFTYARFKLNSNGVSTTHGFVQKTTPNSEPLSLQERKDDYFEKQRQANLLFVDVKEFIERNLTTYSSWQDGSSCGQSSYASPTRVIQ